MQSVWGGGPLCCSLQPVYLLVPPSQGEWDRQPLPEIISKLEEPSPHCAASRRQSPAGPTVVSIGEGEG